MDCISPRLQPRFQTHGLALPLDISWRQIGENVFVPYIKPSTFVGLLSKNDMLSRLAGDIPKDDLEESLLQFWRNFSKQWSSHEVLQVSERKGIPLRRTIPCFLHGDEGRHHKKTGIMILSVQGVLGRGSAPFHKKVLKIWSKKKTQGLNIGGHSFRSRLLLMALPKRFYSQDPQNFLTMFDTIVSDLVDMEQVGFEHQGGRWRLQVLGLKGDLPFLTKAASLERHYLRAARTENPRNPPAGMCFLCAAGKTNVPYEDFTDQAAWLTAPFSRPWVTEPAFLKLSLVRSTPEDFLKPDIWHCFHGGMGMDFAASSLVEMLQLVPGTNIKDKCRSMNRLLSEWIETGNPRPHSGPFLPERVGLTSYQVCPDAGWSKFNDTRIYCKFIQNILERRVEEIWDNSTLLKILDAVQHINQCMSILFSGGLWLTSQQARDAGAHGRKWIFQYDALAKEAYANSMQRFPLLQKIHMLDHQFRDLEDCAKQLQYVWNPAAASVQMDEETMDSFELFFFGGELFSLGQGCSTFCK